MDHHTFKDLDQTTFTYIPLLKCRRNVILLLLKKMKQNTLFIDCFSKKLFQPWLLQISPTNIFDVGLSIHISLSNSLFKIIFLANASILPIFFIFSYKTCPFW